MRIHKTYRNIYKQLKNIFKDAEITYIPDYKYYYCSEPEDIILITGKECSNSLYRIKKSFTLKRSNVEKTYNGDYFFQFKLNDIELIKKWIEEYIMKKVIKTFLHVKEIDYICIN